MIYLLDVIIVIVDSLGYKMLSCDFLQIKPVSAAGKMEAHTTHEVKETHKSQEVQRLTQFTRTLPKVIHSVNKEWGKEAF